MVHMDSLLSFFHSVPLVIVAFLFIVEFFVRILKRDAVASVSSFNNVAVLLLSAIGIATGSSLHFGEHVGYTFFDPCFFYAASLIVVAFKLMLNRAALLKN